MLRSEKQVDALVANWEFDPYRSFERGLADLEAQVLVSTRTKHNIRRALAAIDQSARAELLARHQQALRSFDKFGPKKFADFVYWAFRNVLVAEWLGLDEADPMKILDIGMGGGGFAMVAESMGHKVIGTDVADPWYEELCRIASVERRVQPVVPGEPYRVSGGPFDLVTIMLPTFHRRMLRNGHRQYWSVDEWAVFLRGIVRDEITLDGSIFILMPLDKHADGTMEYSPLLDWGAARGARLGSTLDGVPIRHLLFERAAEQLRG